MPGAWPSCMNILEGKAESGLPRLSPQAKAGRRKAETPLAGADACPPQPAGRRRIRRITSIFNFRFSIFDFFDFFDYRMSWVHGTNVRRILTQRRGGAEAQSVETVTDGPWTWTLASLRFGVSALVPRHPHTRIVLARGSFASRTVQGPNARPDLGDRGSTHEPSPALNLNPNPNRRGEITIKIKSKSRTPGFMAPIRVQKQVLATHEPSSQRRLDSSSSSCSSSSSICLSENAFKAPVRVHMQVEALHDLD